MRIYENKYNKKNNRKIFLYNLRNTDNTESSVGKHCREYRKI
jgi:hypothetical protein